MGPKLLKWVPGDKVRDIRLWLTVYSYWNQGGEENIVSMLYTMIQELKLDSHSTHDSAFESQRDTHRAVTIVQPNPIVENPGVGLYHPSFKPGEYMTSPKEYVQWFTRSHSWVGKNIVAVVEIVVVISGKWLVVVVV